MHQVHVRGVESGLERERVGGGIDEVGHQDQDAGKESRREGWR